jgi:hypothetical protein
VVAPFPADVMDASAAAQNGRPQGSPLQRAMLEGRREAIDEREEPK